MPSTLHASAHSIVTTAPDRGDSVPFQMRRQRVQTTPCPAQGHTPLGSAGAGDIPVELLWTVVCGSVTLLTGPWDPQPGPGVEEERERREIRKQG